jgi:Flp pilus assembly protein TadG
MGDEIGSFAAVAPRPGAVRMRRLLRDTSGVTAVEFALVAPAFMMFMFLIIDGARMTWSYQALQAVATSSARCAALGSTGCKTSSEVKDYAVASAAASGIKLTTDAVTLDSAATCYSVAGMTKVAIASAYQARRRSCCLARSVC